MSQIEQLEGIVTKMGADDAMSAAVYVSSIAEGTGGKKGDVISTKVSVENAFNTWRGRVAKATREQEE